MDDSSSASDDEKNPTIQMDVLIYTIYKKKFKIPLHEYLGKKECRM